MITEQMGFVNNHKICRVLSPEWYAEKGSYIVYGDGNEWLFTASTLAELFEYENGKIKFDNEGCGLMEYHVKQMRKNNKLYPELSVWVRIKLIELRKREMTLAERKTVIFSNFFDKFSFDLDDELFKHEVMALETIGHH